MKARPKTTVKNTNKSTRNTNTQKNSNKPRKSSEIQLLKDAIEEYKLIIVKLIPVEYSEWIEELAQNHINGYKCAAEKNPKGKTARDVDRSKRLIKIIQSNRSSSDAKE